MVTEEQIYNIEKQEVFGDFIVRRLNMDELEVIQDDVIVFKGEDYEVADFINESN